MTEQIEELIQEVLKLAELVNDVFDIMISSFDNLGIRVNRLEVGGL